MVEELFKKYYARHSEIQQDIKGVNFFGRKRNPSASWHDSVLEREERDSTFRLGDRVVICSFRKLLPWLESRYSYECKRSPNLNHSPERLLEGKFLERNGFENHADWYAMKYLPRQILDSGRLRFIRTENFESDFKSVFGNFIDITMIPGSEFTHKINASKSHFPPEFRKKLYDNEALIYDRCPYWKQVEALAYGSTPSCIHHTQK